MIGNEAMTNLETVMGELEKNIGKIVEVTYYTDYTPSKLWTEVGKLVTVDGLTKSIEIKTPDGYSVIKFNTIGQIITAKTKELLYYNPILIAKIYEKVSRKIEN